MPFEVPVRAHRVAERLPENRARVKEAPARLQAVAQPPLLRQDVLVVIIEVGIGVHFVLEMIARKW